MDALSWLIYRINTPELRAMFMGPRNDFRMRDGLVSVLAGNLERRASVSNRHPGRQHVDEGGLRLSPRGQGRERDEANAEASDSDGGHTPGQEHPSSVARLLTPKTTRSGVIRKTDGKKAVTSLGIVTKVADATSIPWPHRRTRGGLAAWLLCAAQGVPVRQGPVHARRRVR